MKDLTGLRFGRWTVLGFAGRRSRERYWACRCDCGTERSVRGADLKTGKSRSCGCLTREAATTHGSYKTPTYRSWQHMIDRCQNPNHRSYRNYGGRGIKVCERWQKFENFLSDMKERQPGTSLDRLDPNLGYSPENCRWLDHSKNSGMTRSTKWLTYNGVSKPMAEWAREFGLTLGTLRKRLKSGWPIEKALNQPAAVFSDYDVTYQGITQPLTEWARELGINRTTLWSRLETCGWSVEKALNQPVAVFDKSGLTYQGITQSIAEWSRELGFKRSTIQKRIMKYGWSVKKALTTPASKRNKME